MTERKAFKKRVRAHMATTGQTYTQAAAHLEASNPARRPDTHPASAAVVALLRESGLVLDPVAAFGIGGGIGFMYGLFEYRESPHALLTLVCQQHPTPFGPSILERAGIDHEAAKGKKELQRMLRAHRAVMLPIARSAVPWLDSDELTASEERVVVVVRDGDDVRILDGTGATALLSPEDVVAGYMATRRKHPVLAVRAGASTPRDLGAAVRSGLRATVSGMTEPVLGNSFDVNFGLSGLRRWAERVSSPKSDGWAQVFAQSDVWRARLVVCIDVEYTAPTAGRPLFARVLREYGYTQAAEHFDASAAHWRAIADGAVHESFDFDRLAEQVVAIADAEELGIEALRRALG